MTFRNPPLGFWALAPLIPVAVLARDLVRSLEGRDAVGEVRLPPPARRTSSHDGGRHGRGWWRFTTLFCLGYSAADRHLARSAAVGRTGRARYTAKGAHPDAGDRHLAQHARRRPQTQSANPRQARRPRPRRRPAPLIRSGSSPSPVTPIVQVPVEPTDRAALTDAIDQLDIYAVARGGTNISPQPSISPAPASGRSAAPRNTPSSCSPMGRTSKGEALERSGQGRTPAGMTHHHGRRRHRPRVR